MAFRKIAGKGNGMKKLKRMMSILCKGEEWIEIVLLVLLTATTAIGVIFRYFVNSPLIWTEELARFIFIWMIAIGVGYCATKHLHIKIEMFVNLMPEIVCKIINVIMISLTLITFIVIIPGANKFMVAQNKILSTALQLPYSYVYSAALIGSFLLIIHLFYNLVLLLFDKEELEK